MLTHKVQRSALLLALFTSLGCTRPQIAAQAPPDPVDDPLAPLTIFLERPEVTGPGAWGVEQAGLVMGLLEAGLGDLAGVIPKTNAPLPPGLIHALGRETPPWRLFTQLDTRSSGTTALLARLCSPAGDCQTTRIEGPGPLADRVGFLLAWCAQILGHAPADAALAGWKSPLSSDEYAVLVAGRSAATWYGYQSAPAVEGDRKKDPVARAVHLDPKLSLAQWILGRRHAARGQLPQARDAFRAAVLHKPHSLMYRADEAAILTRMGAPEATAAWEMIEKLAPDDPRFVLEQAALALTRGRWTQARQAMDEVPPHLRGDPSWLRLRWSLAQKSGETAATEPLLLAWRDAAMADPQPVEALLSLTLAQGRLFEALGHAESLASRGETSRAQQLRVALLLAMGRAEGAATEAEAVDPTLAARIRATLGGPTPQDTLGSLVEAQRLLAQRDPEGALALLERVRRQDPWLPEAIALAMLAHQQAGRSEKVETERALLSRADPALAAKLAQGPNIAPGATETGVQPQSHAP